MARKRPRSRTPRKSWTSKKRIYKRAPNNRHFVKLLKAPVPNRMLVPLRYVQTISLDPGSGTPAGHVFRANSIHDPDYTGVGHQPLGHDIFEQLYRHYIVQKSKISCTFLSSSSDGALGPAIVSIGLRDDNVLQTDMDLVREQANTTYSVIGGASSGMIPVTLHNSYKVSEFFSRNPTDDQLGASFGSNPTEGSWYHVQAIAANQSSDTVALSVQVSMSFEVLLGERKPLDAS